jgi:uncharacterized protein (TIRG00374 family)
MNSRNALILSIIGISLFYFFFALYSDLGQVIKAISSMNLIYIPVVLLFIGLGVLVKGVRQYYLLRANKIQIPIKENIIIYISGLSLIFTPGGIGGLVKTKFFKDKFKIPIKNTIPITLMELYHEFLGLVSAIAIGIIFYDFIEATIALFFGTIIVSTIYIFLRYPNITRIFRSLFSRIKILQRIIESSDESHKDLQLLTSAKVMIISWAITITSMFLELFGIYCIFLAFNIVQFNIIKESQIYLTALLFGQISFLPNGIGVADFSFIGMLISRKIDIALATSVVLIVRFISLWFKTGMGLIALKFVNNNSVKD